MFIGVSRKWPSKTRQNVHNQAKIIDFLQLLLVWKFMTTSLV